jgi:hypothetical protein
MGLETVTSNLPRVTNAIEGGLSGGAVFLGSLPGRLLGHVIKMKAGAKTYVSQLCTQREWV